MKGSIKTGDLGQPPVPPFEKFDQLNLSGEVLGIIRLETAQLGQQRSCNQLRLPKLASARDDSMANPRDRSKCALPLKPLRDKSSGRAMVARGNFHAFSLRAGNRRNEPRIGQTDSFDFA